MKSIRVALWVALLAALLAILGCESSAPPDAEEPQTATEETAAAEAAEEEPEEPLTGKHVVVFKTTKGDFKVELDADAAPKTVENFLTYVDRKFYDHTIFDRVRKNDIIQGGGFTMDTGGVRRKWAREPIENESDNGLKNERGTIAMLRGEDPDSATSQFFINLKHNRRLDRDHPKGDGSGYCVFGKVIEGMDVVDEIGSAPNTTKGSYKNLPSPPVFLSSVQRESES